MGFEGPSRSDKCDGLKCKRNCWTERKQDDRNEERERELKWKKVGEKRMRDMAEEEPKTTKCPKRWKKKGQTSLSS